MNIAKLISIGIVFCFSAFPSAVAAEKMTDINRCIEAARLFADVDLSRVEPTYDGGFFTSDVIWTDSPRVWCTVSSRSVTDLTIENIRYIIDGFSGLQSKTDYEAVERVVSKINEQMETWQNELDQSLEVIRGYYQQPVSDYERKRQTTIEILDPIAVRVLGDRDDFVRFFFRDDLSAVETLSIASRDQQIEDMALKIVGLEDELRVLELQAAAAQDEAQALQLELDTLLRPIEDDLESLFEKIGELDFESVAEIYERLLVSPFFHSSTQQEAEELLAELVRTIPASEVLQNLAGYQLLSSISPENLTYAEKAAFYSLAAAEAERGAEDEQIAGWLRHSDDFSENRTKMILAARDLMDTAECTSAQLEEFGGWVRSSTRSGMYFMDCGEVRYWLDPNEASTANRLEPVNRNRAEQICQNAIKSEVIGEPRFMLLEKSYQAHSLLANVTYIQGFSVRTGTGSREAFRAQCTIKPDESLEIDITRY